MSELSIRERTLRIIQDKNLPVKKKYGQNFLVREEVFEKIIEAARIQKDDAVLEIGPGIGALTGYLARSAGFVTAVEIDKNLIPVLKETLADHKNVEIVNDDILKTDIYSLMKDRISGQGFKVVANLPYYITTPIIMELIKEELPVLGMTFMVQKEVAERMTAVPGSKAYGALSIAVQFYSDARIVTKVPPEAFIPSPEVESAVVHMSMPKEKPVSVKNKELFFNLVRASFNQRRKTLYNGIKNYPGLDIPPELIMDALERVNHGKMVRGEELSIEEFAVLSDCFDMKSML